jgi:hypothetical protein
MAKLKDGSRVYGSLTVDTAIVTNSGFQNMVFLTSGTAATFNLPASVQVPGAKFKVTLIGGGAGGATTAATSGTTGSGGGSGAVASLIFTYAVGFTSFTYTVGAAGASNAAGTASNIIYNGVTYTAGSGAVAGTGGTLTNITAGITTSSIAFVGFTGAPAGTNATIQLGVGNGGDTPLGYGKGGRNADAFTAGTFPGAVGNPATGYGAGGSGGRNGSSATARAGGAGAPGLIIFQY